MADFLSFFGRHLLRSPVSFPAKQSHSEKESSLNESYMLTRQGCRIIKFYYMSIDKQDLHA